MTGSEVVQIVSLVLTAAVSIVSLLVRARIIGLEEKIEDLNNNIQAANAMILKQGNTISNLSQQLRMTPNKSEV